MQLTRDETFQVVLNLRTPVPGGQEKVGTGIFILKDNTDPFILTASHVANECNNSTNVVMSDASSNAQSLGLGLFNSSLAWTHHPVADISVLPIEPDPSITTHLAGRFFPADQLNFSTTPPSRDAYLTAVGFPQGLGAFGHFSPFTFRSHASSSLVTLSRADTGNPCDYFTLEDPAVGGYSGGPVFDLGYIIVGAMTTNTGPTICHGIMHGTISDDTGGKIAAVTPCSYVSDII
jgi:hypothetical protein